jgi:phage terminase small subunit
MSMMTPLQAAFCEEYLVDLNGTQAAIRAGYSPRGARIRAGELLRKPKVKAVIDAAMAARSARTGITAERVLEEIAKTAFTDIRALFDGHGRLKRPEDLEDDIASSIASIEVVTKPGGMDEDGNKTVEHIHKIKQWDKIKALELLGKHLGMFVDRHRLEGANGGAVKFVIET